MKQKDIVLIVVVAAFATIISLFISNKIFVKPSNKQLQVYVVQPIVAEFNLPNHTYYNSNSNDPTQLITIGKSNRGSPF